jgi:hypothetical protein
VSCVSRVRVVSVSNLNRAQWGDKFRWIVYNFHQELKVTPYEVSLKIGPQVLPPHSTSVLIRMCVCRACVECRVCAACSR